MIGFCMPSRLLLEVQSKSSMSELAASTTKALIRTTAGLDPFTDIQLIEL